MYEPNAQNEIRHFWGEGAINYVVGSLAFEFVARI
jgi:hypothetical protein